MPLLTKQFKVWSDVNTGAVPTVNHPGYIFLKPARAERHCIFPEPPAIVSSLDNRRHQLQQVVSNQMLPCGHVTHMGVVRQLSWPPLLLC